MIRRHALTVCHRSERHVVGALCHQHGGLKVLSISLYPPILWIRTAFIIQRLVSVVWLELYNCCSMYSTLIAARGTISQVHQCAVGYIEPGDAITLMQMSLLLCVRCISTDLDCNNTYWSHLHSRNIDAQLGIQTSVSYQKHTATIQRDQIVSCLLSKTGSDPI